MDVEKVIAEALFGNMSTAWTCEDGAKHVMEAITANGLTVVPVGCVEALRPFAELATKAENASYSDPLIRATCPITDEDISTVPIGQLRAARAALAKLDQPQ